MIIFVKKRKMKYVLVAFIGILLASCGTKVPYNNQVRDEFDLNSEQTIKKVQFVTSATIILEQNKQSGNQATDSDGTLVSSSNKEQDRIIIPLGTECIFVGYGENSALIVRFENGSGKTLTFVQRNVSSPTNKYYLSADWNNGQNGGTIKYGNATYLATPSSGTAYLQVVRKKLQKTKRKDRVVKGMKV